MMNKQAKLLIIFLLVGCASTQIWAENSIQISRYMTLSTTATVAQTNPLLAVVELKFSLSVQTVNDAIQQLLKPSGYQLVESNLLSSDAKTVLAKPLPYTVRHLGPITIKDGLTVLMGQSVFQLLVDPLHREINFRLNPS